MDTLDATSWDVLIVGTGLQQSLLALALSRSGKQILHIDENPYYGGAEAELRLPDAEEWVAKTNQGAFGAAFAKAAIHRPEPSDSNPTPPSLSHGRQYHLALAPEIMYSRSAFVQHLVRSQAASHVEFVPVGSWWVYSPEETSELALTKAAAKGSLIKVPDKREDLFGKDLFGTGRLGFPTKRKLVKVLHFIFDYEKDEERAKWEPYRSLPFSAFLSAVFKTPPAVLAPIFALIMSNKSPEQITTEYALSRLARHIQSFGAYGAFSALILKHGGLCEIHQFACRACAVGGGVYVLGKGLSTSHDPVSVVQVPVVSRPNVEEETAEAITTEKANTEAQGDSASVEDERIKGHVTDAAKPHLEQKDTKVQAAAGGQVALEKQATIKDMPSHAAEPDAHVACAAEDKSTDERQLVLEERPDEGQRSRDEQSDQGLAASDEPPTSKTSVPGAEKIPGDPSISGVSAPVAAKAEANPPAIEVSVPIVRKAEVKASTSEASVPVENQVEVKRQESVHHVKLHLQDGEAVTAQWVVCEASAQYAEEPICKSIIIVSSPLQTLFPEIEKVGLPASAVLVFPTGSLSLPDRLNHQKPLPPVHIQAHSSDSGECPVGQCVLYASTNLNGDDGFQLLKQATSRLLTSVDVSPLPTILWSMQYEQSAAPTIQPLSLSNSARAHVLTFPPMDLDLAVDDSIIDRVREMWQKITDDDPTEFMVFKDRETPVG